MPLHADRGNGRTCTAADRCRSCETSTHGGLTIGHLKLYPDFPLREFAEAGGLLAYSTNFDDLFRAAADYVDRVLKGAQPGELPVQQATTFELVVNLGAAKALGLTIPPMILARADEVIE